MEGCKDCGRGGIVDRGDSTRVGVVLVEGALQERRWFTDRRGVRWILDPGASDVYCMSAQDVLDHPFLFEVHGPCTK